ncbi:hypothetical protein [Moritella viscosa]|uniref:hypothetical protein n=1 Tax=Moritella viscosa TaxID=80854 RepID=UPI000509286F|nr:hypothetical protein [Moritella viscosa]CED60547.1 putative uncharacterized protein [Moritella viscosa]
MKTKIELTLSYIVFSIALIYGTLVFIKFNFQFTPTQMSYPGMVIAFLMSCMLNIIKLKENSMSSRIHFASVFANILTFSYATAFAIQDPWIGKVITTILMGFILIFSVIKLLQLKM